MTQKTGWPWWTAPAALAASLALCCAVWFGVFSLAGVATKFVDAKVKEGQWSREMVFDTARDLTTGRSVSARRPDQRSGSGLSEALR